MRVIRSTAILILFLLSAFGLSEQGKSGGFCSEEMATLGGVHDSHDSSQNSDEIQNLAKFAVDEHNKKENAIIELARVVKAQEQTVAGKLHHLTLEVMDAGKKKLYKAKVWVKPWLNFKELQEFKHVEDVPTFTSSDLGVKQEQTSGLKSVPVHDPVVEEAAEHAIKTIQQRSNSLLPYELQEIVHANAEMADDHTKLHLVIKTSRGGKEEKFKVQVQHNNEGAFHLNHMEPDN
ncbi:cysteine proteinase inhibitor 6-like isoform X2 [Solanum verrucosum]|uniref:cysteine proteinase inhibitor 6-like isoform X2 n=1 Tax=Solanum verrucosum TaxID=315347 RepID=UPI0020D0F526|nr:cysteine proteinase inhibitor 6-like isoform X2 [Solanum verrucosum]